jgi:putative Holliday junction resolvase
MKLLGIDYGRRRIGVAITDDTGTLVRGLTVIDRDRDDPLAFLARLIDEERPSRVVIGLPLDKDDHDTAMSLEIRRFAERLERRTTLPVAFVDESFSSYRAMEIMLTRRKKQRHNKGNYDRIAACVILETFLRENPPE